MKLKHTTLTPTIGFALALFMQSITAAPLSISDSPLEVSGAIEPNVMLLIDNSGSMSNIVPDTPYDPSVTYFTCGSASVVTSGSSIDIRITSAGAPYLKLGGSDQDWGVNSGTGPTGKSTRCFNPGESYMARLYGNSGGNPKSPSGYLRAQYTGNYLNWYFGSSPTNWGSGARKKPGTEQRIEIAKSASKSLIDIMSGVRVGLSSYNGQNGVKINEEMSPIIANRAAMKSSIDALSPSGSTPLAESLRDIGEYFTQGYSGNLTIHPGQSTSNGDLFNESEITKASFFARDGAYTFSPPPTPPIQAFCQKNFAILLTDGRPQSDRSMSSSLEDYDGDCLSANPACNSYDRKPSQGYESAGSDYLDDVAKALFEINLRPNLTDFNGNPVVNNIKTYTIGFTDDQVINDPLMQDTANNGGGIFITAENSEQLASAFNQAVGNVNNQISSAASAALNTGFITNSSKIYQPTFDSSVWRGDLSAVSIKSDGSLDPNENDPLASDNLPGPNNRVILTFDTTKKMAPPGLSIYGDGIPFRWSSLNAAQQTALNTAISGASDGNGSDRLSFLRGDSLNETVNGGIFRTRPLGKLGDFVHSSPVFVKNPPFRYPDNWGAGAPENNEMSNRTYSTFKSDYSSRTPMVYLGANDGMLHGFDAITLTEKLAYVPQAVFNNLSDLTDPNYNHKFYVDGSPTMGDVYFNNDWHTVLIGGLNNGGQGIYALDITSPATFSEANSDSIVLWEFRDENDADADSVMQYGLGKTYSQPAIMRMHNGKWAAVFGNGYNNTTADGYASSSGHAILYILDIETGEVIKKINTEVGSATTPNGLATPAGVDVNGDHIVDVIYAGDLRGNLWKFNVNDKNPVNWDINFSTGSVKTPLFSATDSLNNPQPITVRPDIGLAPSGPGVMVYFGTGLYLGSPDVTDSSPQAFYGIIDTNQPVSNRNNLISQTINVLSTANIRISSATQLATSNSGWYLDLPATGERVVVNPILRTGKIIFVTLIPDSRQCGFGGTGWLMELDPIDGSQLKFPPFDLDDNGSFDLIDTNNDGKGDTPPSGVISEVGILTTPGILMGNDIEYKYSVGSNGSIQKIGENPGIGSRGRQAWRQMR